MIKAFLAGTKGKLAKGANERKRTDETIGIIKEDPKPTMMAGAKGKKKKKEKEK